MYSYPVSSTCAAAHPPDPWFSPAGQKEPHTLFTERNLTHIHVALVAGAQGPLLGTQWRPLVGPCSRFLFFYLTLMVNTESRLCQTHNVMFVSSKIFLELKKVHKVVQAVVPTDTTGGGSVEQADVGRCCKLCFRVET